MDKDFVEAQGVWLRRRGDRLEVLVQVGETWRVAIVEPWPSDGQAEISHIVEPKGIRNAPHDCGYYCSEDVGHVDHSQK